MKSAAECIVTKTARVCIVPSRASKTSGAGVSPAIDGGPEARPTNVKRRHRVG